MRGDLTYMDIKDFKKLFRKKFHRHYWVYIKDDPDSKIVQVIYEDPQTGETSTYPQEGSIVRHKTIKVGAIYRCKTCGKEIKYCGIYPYPSGNSPQE